MYPPPTMPPQSPNPPGGPTASGGRPVTVTAAVGAMMGAVLITVGMVAVTIVNLVTVLDKIKAIGVSPDLEDQVETFFKAAEIVSIVLYMLFAVAVALLALGNLRGKRGTWIATFVVSGTFALCGFCGVISSAGGGFGGSATGSDASGSLNTDDLLPDWSAPVSVMLNVLLVLAHAAAIVLLAIRPSSAFFARPARFGAPDPNYPTPGGPGYGATPGYGASPGYGPGAPGPGYGAGPGQGYGADPTSGTGYGGAPASGPSYGADPASGPGYSADPASGPGYGGPPSGPGYGGPPPSGPGYGGPTSGPGYGGGPTPGPGYGPGGPNR